MTTGSFAAAPMRCVLELGGVGRRAAAVAAALTVGGAVTLGVFFTVGEPWGTINDWLSIGLGVATLPIAIELAGRNPRSAPLVLGAAFDVAGVAVSTVFTALLIARRMTFEESLAGVLGGQALIGCWLLLVGLAAWSDPGSRRLATLAVTGGGGLVTTAVGVQAGGMESPIGAVGFMAALIGTAGFYALVRRRPER